MEASSSDSIMKMEGSKAQFNEEAWDLDEAHPEEKKRSGILNVVVSGLALFSDGYNAQISTSWPLPSHASYFNPMAETMAATFGGDLT